MKIEKAINNIEFKKDEDLQGIHYLLYMVLVDMAAWMSQHGYVMTVTCLISTLEEDEDLNRESDAHRTRRAADLRCRHMRLETREKFRKYFNVKYKDIASVSRSDRTSRLVVEHGEGENRHFHVALNYKFRMVN